LVIQFKGFDLSNL